MASLKASKRKPAFSVIVDDDNKRRYVTRHFGEDTGEPLVYVWADEGNGVIVRGEYRDGERWIVVERQTEEGLTVLSESKVEK